MHQARARAQSGNEMKSIRATIFGRFAMTDERSGTTEDKKGQQGAKPARFLGSLKDALVAAGRDDTVRGAKPQAEPEPVTQAIAKPRDATQKVERDAGGEAAAPKEPVTVAAGAVLSAAEAAREAKSQTSLKPADKHVEFAAPPTTRVVRGAGKEPEQEAAETTSDAPRTQLVRGKVKVERGDFDQDPVVGWLVVVGGPGMGSYRPIFEGNNTVGRSNTQRIALNFGDDTISSEEQAYIRYDSSARSFLFVPNLAKTNVVSVNDKRPTGAVELNQMDVITIGRTQLVFVPFCGADFDWAELTDANK
jgi:FHA domain